MKRFVRKSVIIVSILAMMISLLPMFAIESEAATIYSGKTYSANDTIASKIDTILQAKSKLFG